MDTTATLYESASRSLTTVVEALPAEAWTSPSPCEGWTARDVLRHLVETQRDFLTGHGVELGAAPDLEAGPGRAWRDHAERVLDALTDDAVVSRAYDGYFGPTTVGETLEKFYVFDMVVHRWDIARTARLDAQLSEAELDRLDAEVDSLGPALYTDGICKPPVEAPGGADRETEVLARLGRAAWR